MLVSSRSLSILVTSSFSKRFVLSRSHLRSWSKARGQSVTRQSFQPTIVWFHSSFSPNKKADEDFVHYLKGASKEDETEPPSLAAPNLNKSDELGVDDQQAKTEIHSEEHKEPTDGMDKDEGDEDVERWEEEGMLSRRLLTRQRLDQEERRMGRVSTVQRALMGNMFITACKLAAYLHSGSSAMLSEFIHSVVDSGNQALLLIGLRDVAHEADGRHPYGYGKSIYFWALVSALGTFFLGAGVSMAQALPELYQHLSAANSTVLPPEFSSWHVWTVLGISFVVDGYVLRKTLLEIPVVPGQSMWSSIWKLRDPATLAIVLEDGAACLGVIVAMGGIAASQYTGTGVYDALAGVGISTLLATMGMILVRVNHRFLLGQSVDPSTIQGIQNILLKRRSIDNVHRIQTQHTGPETFTFKAEVDFDGTFLAAKLMPKYQPEFVKVRTKEDVHVLLSWYAEDVMRTVEREVRHIETLVQKHYPGAEYIELEPMSSDADRFAIDDGMEAQIKRIEIEALNRYLKALYKHNNRKHSSTTIPPENNKLTNDNDTKNVEKSTNNTIEDKTTITYDWQDDDNPDDQFPKKS